ncbi:MAG TPA: glycosyltransferase family 4 protein [Saprospiraceae bacterium]|nr:glycosyltransferase family 4 protein [Saprospiraceae bacterium]
MEVIHIVLGKANPDRLNGVNKVVYQMASEQTKAGKKVEVWGITSKPEHNYPPRNFKTRLFKTAWFPFGVDASLKKAILQHKDAVYHLHGGWIPVFSSLAKYFAKHKIRFVLTPHGAYNEVAMKRSNWKKKFYFQLFEKGILRSVHKVHSIGKSEVTGLESICQGIPSFLLPYGFNTVVNTRAHSKNEVFTVGFVGRLDTYTKGLDLLIEAFEQFHCMHPQSILWIIGDGEGMEYLSKYKNDNKSEHIVLWGKKFGNEKDALISQMHVFVHPSRNEGLPTAVLEAASMGVGSIVTQATNVAEYIDQYKAGIGIDNENVRALKEAMEQFYNAYQNNTLGQYAAGAGEMLADLFAWPSLVEKYDELYQ